MKFFILLYANIKRKKIRTFLTVGSYFTAFLLFGLLAAIKSAFHQGVDVAGANRLVVANKTSIIMPLPLAYRQKIHEIDGVNNLTYATWFGGYYKDPKNFFPQMAIDSESYFKVYKEFKVDKKQFEDFMKDKQGCVIGKQTAEKYGFKIGDRIPIIASIWGGVWEFNLRAIYTGSKVEDDLTQFFFHASYLEERRQWGKGMVGWYIVEIKNPELAFSVSKEIDRKFANSPYETKSDTEKAFALGFVKQIGNIELIILTIGGIVFFTLLLVTSNTMELSIRERSMEIAVLKTIGFSDKLLYFLTITESLFYSLFGGALGITAAKIFTLKGDPTGGFLPVFYISLNHIALGFLLVFFFGFLSGALPANRVYKLKIVETLGRV